MYNFFKKSVATHVYQGHCLVQALQYHNQLLIITEFNIITFKSFFEFNINITMSTSRVSNKNFYTKI